MDEVQRRSGGNNDRREVENRSGDQRGDEDEVAKGIIQRIQSRAGRDEEEALEQLDIFPEGDLEVGNLEVPENDPKRARGGER